MTDELTPKISGVFVPESLSDHQKKSAMAQVKPNIFIGVPGLVYVLISLSNT